MVVKANSHVARNSFLATCIFLRDSCPPSGRLSRSIARATFPLSLFGFHCSLLQKLNFRSIKACGWRRNVVYLGCDVRFVKHKLHNSVHSKQHGHHPFFLIENITLHSSNNTIHPDSWSCL